MQKSKQTHQQKLQENITRAQQGHKQVEGDVIYTFENHKNHDLALPRKSFDDKTLIPPRGKFKGDAYFLMLMKTGYVRLVSSEPYIRPEVAAAAAAEAAKLAAATANQETLNENVQENKTMDKLILDQPEKVTARGHQQEHVVADPNTNLKQIKEQGSAPKGGEVLLTENPLDGIDIITG